MFAGPGPGLDIVYAARRGLQITAVDCNAFMLQATAQRLQQAGVSHRVELVHADLLQRTSTPAFDVVIAQFFLNVFAVAHLPQVIQALGGHLAPAGRLIVGDFAAIADGNHPWQSLYHDLPMHVLACFGANAVHDVHDLPRHLQAAGFAVRERRDFRLFGIGPAWIEGLVAEPAHS